MRRETCISHLWSLTNFNFARIATQQGNRLRLAELINLENELIACRDADPQQLRKRDRAIGKKLEQAQASRAALFLAWLDELGPRQHSSLGERVVEAYRTMQILLLIVGVLAGASAASATLAFDGSSPVNVVHFLAVFVGMQTLFLLFFVISLLPNRIAKWIPGHGELLHLVRSLSYFAGKLAGRVAEQLPADKSSRWQQDWHALRLRHKLYQKVERWLLYGLTQRFSLAFNTGALVLCLYLIVFSDLAFAWNTTLQVSSQAFHEITTVIAAPWAAFSDQAVPSLELVELSRYFRIEGQYQIAGESARSSNPAAVGGWWPFLVLSLVTYGLLPRMLTFLLTRMKLNSLLKNVPLDSADCDALYDRLTTPIIETRAIEPEEPAVTAHQPYAPVAVQAEVQTCDVVLWGEIALDRSRAELAVQQRFGWRCQNVLPAGGLDAQVDDETCSKLTKDGQEKQPILVLVESWEVPNKALLHFLQQLRSKSTPKRALLVGLINTEGNGLQHPPEREDWQTWRETLADLQDPYLRVETMVVTA